MVPIHLHETAALYYSLALIMIGAQFMSFGFLGEMITAYLVRESDTYSIREHTAPGRVIAAAAHRQSERDSHDGRERGPIRAAPLGHLPGADRRGDRAT